MQSNTIKIALVISGILLLLGLYAALSFYKSGEIIRTMKGEVQKCEILGGGKKLAQTHATIRSENGNYIIASLNNCSPGIKVRILIKRGALYFNTVYAAEKA